MRGRVGQKRIPRYSSDIAMNSTPRPVETQADPGRPSSLTEATSLAASNQYLARIDPYPENRFSGRGIVLCGGGIRYFTNAWIAISLLRHVGVTLPIQFWYLGPTEMDGRMRDLLASKGAQCVDGHEIRKVIPARILNGWELKAYAALNCSFREVLLLDADNMVAVNPEYLFETSQYRETGAIFWSDFGNLQPENKIWSLLGIEFRDEPELESGQLIMDKQRCWKALSLAMWINEYSDFYYQYVYGDKETFHLAFHKAGTPYSMPNRRVERITGTMLQYDFDGRLVFQHRNTQKWDFFGENAIINNFHGETECRLFLESLREQWDGRVRTTVSAPSPRPHARFKPFRFRPKTYDRTVFYSIVESNEYQLPDSFKDDDIIIDIGVHIGAFSFACLQRNAGQVIGFEPEQENFDLARDHLAVFRDRCRLIRKAVWRSDVSVPELSFGGYLVAVDEINTGGGSVLDDHWEKIGIPANNPGNGAIVSVIGLDEILREFPRVRMLKLDCEGSEWPILLTSRELGRVDAICGEFHLPSSYSWTPTSAALNGLGTWNPERLQRFLEQYYSVVKIRKSDVGLGYFSATGSFHFSVNR